MTTPALPSGFTLDADHPPLPLGFTLDAPQEQSTWEKVKAYAGRNLPKEGEPHSFVQDAVQGVQAAAQWARPLQNLMPGAGLVAPLAAPEAGLHTASQMAAFPVQGTASAYQLATSKPGQRVINANRAVSSVGNAMIYQPRTEGGQNLSNTVDSVMAVPAKIGDSAGDWVTDRTGSAGLGAATSLAIQSVPVILGAKYSSDKAASQPAGVSSAEATARAKSYVSNRTGLDWNSLSTDFQQKLASVAQNATSLDNLDPAAVARQARLEKLGLPATRGQVTRDLGQLTTEENLTRADAGKGIRGISSAQDVKLHELVNALRDPGAPETPLGVGEAVQGAARQAESASQSGYEALYDKAKETQPNVTVPADAIEAFVKGNPEVLNPQIQHLGWLQSWLNKAKIGQAVEEQGAPQVAYDGMGMAQQVPGVVSKVAKSREVRLAELQDLRTKANKIKAGGGTDAYYAGEVIKAIDASMEKAPEGATAWKEANSAFRDHKIKFEDQGGVNRLVDNASRTDPRVALEDTFNRTVRTGSNEQLRQVRDLLTKDASPEGVKAWNSLRSATIDYLREKAAGKRAIPGEQGQLQFNSTFVDALHDLASDGKIETLFGKDGAAQLQAIADATRDVRTKPATRIAGSDTAPRLVAIFEKFAGTIQKVPVVGDTAVGIVKGVQKLRQMGEEARTAKTAETLPVDEAAQTAQVNALRSKRSTQAGNALRKMAPGIIAGESQNALRKGK